MCVCVYMYVHVRVALCCPHAHNACVRLLNQIWYVHVASSNDSREGSSRSPGDCRKWRGRGSVHNVEVKSLDSIHCSGRREITCGSGCTCRRWCCSTHVGNEASEVLQLCVTEESCIHEGVCQWPCSYIEALICGIVCRQILEAQGYTHMYMLFMVLAINIVHWHKNHWGGSAIIYKPGGGKVCTSHNGWIDCLQWTHSWLWYIYCGTTMYWYHVITGQWLSLN